MGFRLFILNESFVIAQIVRNRREALRENKGGEEGGRKEGGRMESVIFELERICCICVMTVEGEIRLLY